MPFKSLAQERYFNANRAKLERQGVSVDEWNAASKGMKLPMKAKKMPMKKMPTMKMGIIKPRKPRLVKV